MKPTIRYAVYMVCALLAGVTGRTSAVSAPLSAGIVISEVMFNPDGNENAREFVEVYNRGDVPADLTGWMLCDGTACDRLVPYGAGYSPIPPGGYGVILDPDYDDAGEPYPELPPGIPRYTVEDAALGNRGLSNSTSEPVTLVTAAGDTASAVTYDLDTPAGRSWERIDLSGPDDPSNFGPSAVHDGTPGLPNSIAAHAGNSSPILTLRTEPDPVGETSTISFALPFTYARARLTVYDRRGREVTVLLDGIEAGSSWSGTWNGGTDHGRLPAGPYLLVLEALDRDTGSMHQVRQPIVVAPR